MVNRLADAMSPYLRQHATNPVDWWEWGEAAFAEARRRDVPLLISVGYSTCHWCHVMARESFADPVVAEALNPHFVPVKVDREERPDVDAVYLAATQATTGHAGWPMTVFATPDGQPFFCGTYFPRDEFLRLLSAISRLWRERRDEVVRRSAEITGVLSRVAAPVRPDRAVDAPLLAASAAALVASHDDTHGGLGSGAPKFPPHMALLFLLRHHRRTGDAQALEVARHTCEQMARGGIYDQLAGGFARYSVDESWTVPHFEKMLYDNALLLRVYTLLWRLTCGMPSDGGRPSDPSGGLAGRVAREIVDFLWRTMRLPDGGFAAALDADTDGVEGATYVWTPDQLREALGHRDGEFAADLFGVTADGTFEAGTSVLRLARDVDDADPAVVARWRDVRRRLREARDRRPQPARDDKVVAAWNGLAVTALCEYLAVARALAPWSDDPGTPGRLDVLADGVVRTADLLARHLVDGRLRRVSRAGLVGEAAGVLDDYGCVAEAFCAMHQLTGDGRWLELAGRLIDTARARFGDGHGGYHDTADDAERLVTRPADPTDTATPAGRSALAAAMTAYAALTGRAEYRAEAAAILAGISPLLPAHARAVGYTCAVAEALESGPYEIAVATPDPTGDPLVATAHLLAPPGAVVVAGEPDRPGVPLLAGRPLVGGRPTAYVCQGFVCDLPVTDPAALAGRLTSA